MFPWLFASPLGFIYDTQHFFLHNSQSKRWARSHAALWDGPTGSRWKRGADNEMLTEKRWHCSLRPTSPTNQLTTPASKPMRTLLRRNLMFLTDQDFPEEFLVVRGNSLTIWLKVQKKPDLIFKTDNFLKQNVIFSALLSDMHLAVNPHGLVWVRQVFTEVGPLRTEKRSKLPPKNEIFRLNAEIS